MYHHSYASKVINDRYVVRPSVSNRRGIVRSLINSLRKNTK